jgi:coenzyme Q-binding protein COQ10
VDGVRILRADKHAIIADLVAGSGPFRECFTSEVTLDRPTTGAGARRRRAVGPLRRSQIGPAPQVDFIINFQLKSELVNHVTIQTFHKAARRMMSVFESRFIWST